MPSPSSKQSPENRPEQGSKVAPIPERFLASRATLRVDRLMTRVIAFGGVSIITAVLGIFAFIAFVIWPLFQSPQMTVVGQVSTGVRSGSVVALGERGDFLWTYSGGAEIHLKPVEGEEKAVLSVPLGFDPVMWKLSRNGRRLLLGSGDGRIGTVSLVPNTEGTQETLESAWDAVGSAPVSLISGELPPGSIRDLDLAESGSKRCFAGLVQANERVELRVVEAVITRDLLGNATVETRPVRSLSDLAPDAEPVEILTPSSADSVLVRCASGEVLYFYRDLSGWELRQRFKPFAGVGKELQMALMFGDVTALFADPKGRLRLFSLFIAEGSSRREFGLTREMNPLDGGVDYLRTNHRNKTFVVGNDRELAVCHATTEAVRMKVELKLPIRKVLMDGRAEHLGLVDQNGDVGVYRYEDPHPEAGWKTFFGKIWYEGHAGPKWMWQSTGGTDDYEAKLSLVPLIVGSLKGTFYAMLFSIPIALLAAIFTSQFLPEGAKRIIKPTMEIMASLPSVVLGFLAALWLAPLIEDRVPSIFLMVISVPLVAMVASAVWKIVPLRYRNRLPPGAEAWLLVPLLLLGLVGAWQAGPSIERLLFVATLGDGTRIADFRLWWPEFTGLPFDQRNCLVVGFMMGFAVIPVIFTIAEDALSNVPPALTSAAEALGASRWQVVRTVVLPVASAGIFSALMIGLGRAVGETMIVVMATGNTPIMDESGRLLFGSHWNLFDGMRTLSANIAVELPEAALNSTHYRTLFLGAMVLFLLTFCLNTVAELLRQRLRKKFQII